MISLGALMPHPPIIVPGIGKSADLEQVSETIQSMHQIDNILEQDQPETYAVPGIYPVRRFFDQVQRR